MLASRAIARTGCFRRRNAAEISSRWSEDLSRDGVAAATRIGPGPPGSFRSDLDGAHRARPPFPFRPFRDAVTQGRQRLERLARNAPLSLHLAGSNRVRPERVGMTARRDTWRLDGNLRIHAEDGRV